MTPRPPTTTYRLSRRQQWKLVLSTLLVYYPVLYYVFTLHWTGWPRELPGLLVNLGTMLPFYFVWVLVAEWLHYRLARWLGADFILDMKLPAQLTLFGLSLVLGISFLLAWTSALNPVQQYVLPQLRYETGQPHSAEYWVLFQRANQGFFLLLMLAVFYQLNNRLAVLRLEASRQRTEQLEKENLQAQLAALKNQVNPHFLFNSLSILSSLVHTDADLAEQFVEQLALAYRYALEQKDHDLVPLGTEVEFINAYTFLLKLRFADKFRLRLDLPDAARLGYQIAPLTLQLLIENAVKHNQMSALRPLHVSIELDDQELVVRNTLQLRPAVASTGLGLLNIRNRYRLLTPRPVAAGAVGPEFVVRIPLLPA